MDVKDLRRQMPVDMALGVGEHGRAGGPPMVRRGTAALLGRLMSQRGSVSRACRFRIL